MVRPGSMAKLPQDGEEFPVVAIVKRPSRELVPNCLFLVGERSLPVCSSLASDEVSKRDAHRDRCQADSPGAKLFQKLWVMV